MPEFQFSLDDHPTLLWDPTPDQLRAIEVMPNKPRFILADATGLGKTYSTLASFSVLKERCPDLHLLVLCPVSATVSWGKDLRNGTRLSYVELGVGSKQYNRMREFPHPVTILNYSAIEHFKDYILALFNSHPLVLVLDEGHHLKNPKAGVTQILSRWGPLVRYMWVLTATPVTNHLEDLYFIVNLTCPGYLGTLYDFLERYTVRKEKLFRVPQGQKLGRSVRYIVGRSGKKVPYRVVKEIVGTKNLPELAVRLRPILLRRDLDLDIEFVRIEVRLTEEEELAYTLAAQGCLGTDIRDFAGRLPDLQLAVNNAVTNAREPNESECLSSKEKRWIEECKELLQAGPLTCFTSSIPTVNRLWRLAHKHLDKKGSRLWRITGETPKSGRDEVAEKFGGNDLLLISQAGGESLNLQAAGTILFYDLPFDLKMFVQAVGRVARMDTKHETVFVRIMEAVGTIDSYKAFTILSNADTFKSVLKGASTLPPVMSGITKEALAHLRKELLWRTKRSRARN